MPIFAETQDIVMHRNKTILRALAVLAASLISTLALNAQAGFGSAEKFNDGWKVRLKSVSVHLC